MSNKTPKLSILIPTYNRVDFVSDAIESVLNQPFDDYEIICSDNASTDGTYQLLESYASRYPRIKVFQNDKNLGPVLNWKNCLDHATGDYIHWLWSDDWIEPNFYLDAFSLMERDKTNLVSTWNYRSDNDANPDDKYISWCFSHPLVSGVLAAKKILLMTRELPASPAAYILPAEHMRKHFYVDIPVVNNIDPVANGVGVDSLMVAGCCVEQDYVSILQKPSVVFRAHDNISTSLSRDGVLGVMYMISHVWFMGKAKLKLSLLGYVFLMLRVVRAFKGRLLIGEVSRFLFVAIRKIGLQRSFSLSGKAFISKRAVFKK